jgi:hypothetical protein
MIELKDAIVELSEPGKTIWLSEYNIVTNVKPPLVHERDSLMAIHEARKKTIGQPLDMSLEQGRWLSELGLCGCLPEITLPAGFNTILGVVKLSKDLPKVNGSTRNVVHKFGYHEDGRILCVTFGQFYDSEENLILIGGDRVRFFERKAPNLITLFPDHEIAVLLGQKEEIKQKLGLDYNIYREMA